MWRAADICDKLAVDPFDPALKPYYSMCNPVDSRLKPRPPSMLDFVQLVSSCVGGLVRVLCLLYELFCRFVVL